MPRRKRQIRARVPTAARVDVMLRLGPGTEGSSHEAAIACMAGWLGLSAGVGDQAKEVFRKIEASWAKAWPGIPGWTKLRSMDPLYAACLSIACRNEGSPRSLKQLASATAEGGFASMKEIARLTTLIRARLGEEAAGRGIGVGAVRPSSYLCHFCQALGMGDREAAQAKEAARCLEGSTLEVPHIGESVAAGVVCLALQRADCRHDVLSDVAAATGVTRATINNVCDKLRPHAGLLFG